MRTILNAVLAATLLLTGCSAVPTRPASAPSRLPDSIEDTAPVVGTNFGAFFVTAKFNDSVSPEVRALGLPLPRTAQKGKRRLVVLVRATNTSDGPVAVQIEHNLPVLADSSGNPVAALQAGGISVGRATGELSAQGERLERGGVITALAFYDLAPAQRDLTLTWQLGEDVAVFKVR